MWNDGIFKGKRKRTSSGRRDWGKGLHLESRKRSGAHREWMQALGWLVVVLGLILGIGVLCVMGTRSLARVLFSENPRFCIRQFEIQTDGTLALELVRQYARVKEGDNLYAVDLRKVRKEILGVPIVESVLVQRKLPDTLRIRITERVPLARISVAGLPEMALDLEGVILGPSYASPALPRIEDTRMDSLRPGSRVEQSAVMDALDLLDTCGKTRMGLIARIVRIRLEDDERMILELEQGDRVLFPRTQMNIKLRRLVSILKAIQDRQMRKSGQNLEIDMTTESNWPVTGLLE
jgi:cell division septal protein FtsQ